VTRHRDSDSKHPASGDPRDDELLDLLALCARWLLQAVNPQAFIEQLAHEGPRLFPALLQGDDMRAPGAQRRADASRFFRSFAWAVVGATPLPALGFRPHKLTLPGRNEPCLCGSLRKYKHCCAEIVPLFPKLDAELLGALVIDALPRKEWAALPHTRVGLDMVTGAAQLMCDEDRFEDAARLLQAWADLPPPWPDARAELLDQLGDVYLELGKPRKRKQLALAMVKHGAPAVQSKGWQRLCLLATDAGDDAAARRAFEAAQRLAPDDPSVALLEVTTLMGQGQLERARERASFHAKRLARLPNAPALVDAIEALAELAQADSALGQHLQQFSDSVAPERVVAQLEAWLAALPEPRLQLALPAEAAADLQALTPTAAAKKALKRWRGVFEFSPPRMAWEQVGDDALAILDVDGWMPELHAQPLLGDCFEVLDGLLLALGALPMHHTARVQVRLMERAMALWAQLRARQPSALCEWAHLDNRPALRLLVQRIELDASGKAENTFEWLQHIVEVLNPHDNHGLRERLAAVYLRRGDVAQALALCERYPGDGVGMRLLHARALLAVQRLDEAAATVSGALRDNAHLRKLLLAARAPRLPDVASYALGSIDEAKIVLAPQFDLWRGDPGVRQWLKQLLDAAEPGSARTVDLFGSQADPPIA
jgi:tetratricopeptide (TPR) repeat protein